MTHTNLTIFPNKRIEEFYHLYERLLTFTNLSWWIIDLGYDPNIFYCNKTMCKTFSLNEEIAQHSVTHTCPIAGDYNKNIATRSSAKAKQIFNEYHQLRKGFIDEYSNNFPYYDSETNETSYFSSRARALVKDKSGNATVLFGIIEPERTTEELHKKVKTDSLTDLFNRREFDFQIEFLFNLAIRENHNISLIMCDIDHFKQYNDNLGHYAGDECLIQIAHAISTTCVRSSEIACRYGGEEFAIIVFGGEKDASYLAEVIRKKVYVMAIPHPALNNTPVTLSVGYYSFTPDPTSSPKFLIECADKALYEAKEIGKNTCVQFQE